MEEFKKRYKEEANDLIHELEKDLFILEANPNDKTLIEQVFRTMHSLKGGGAMFGYDLVSSFTHELESVYDLIRNGTLAVTEEVLSITFLAVDHLKKLFESDNYSQETINEGKDLKKRVKNIIEKAEATESSEATVEIAEDPTNDFENNQANYITYRVFFKPDSNIFKNGTNLLYLIDELHVIGDCLAFPIVENIPQLDSFEAEKSYFSWEIFLATKEGVNEIKDVFIFIEDECEIIVKEIGIGNLLSDNKYVEEITQKYGSTGRFLKMKKKQETLADETKQTGIKKTQKKDIPQVEVSPKNNIVKKNIVEKKISGFKPLKQQSKETIISSVRVSSEKIDALMNLVSELVTTQASLSLYAEEKAIPGLVGISENVENISRQLRDIAFNISLIPLETLMTRFQRLVRDLSSDLNKKVEFKAIGVDTELDKNLIQAISEPLMHIIRNSIDHGIESKEERIAAGKKPEGEIVLKAFYSGANVVIQIIDDGKGIDKNIIRKKAISKGLLTEDTIIKDKELYNFIFIAGFSTATTVTGVSGRGVGMDVVKRKISEMRGEVDVYTEIGKGTTMSIKLPLTLSIIDGLLVRIDDTKFIIPLSVVDKIYPVEHRKVIDSFNNIVVLDGTQISYHNLSTEFEMTKEVNNIDEMVVVKYEDKRIGLVVDVVIGEYQAVLKPLGTLYKDQEMISGATILGDGTVALVMDTNKIIKILSGE